MAFTREQHGKHIFKEVTILKQWPSKHISMVTNKHATVEGSWKPFLVCGVRQGCIGRTSWQLVVGWLVGGSVGWSVSQFMSLCILVVALESFGG